MLVVSPSGETTWLDRAQSAPLWGDVAVRRPEESLRLERGSLLVLYSDGLVERRGEVLDDGLRRLAAAGRDVADMAVEEVCSTLMTKLGVDSSRNDDVAVMAMRFEPGSGSPSKLSR